MKRVALISRHPTTPGDLASYPALRMKQNDHRFYFTTIPKSDVFPYCFVSRRDEDPTAGFQRALSEERAVDIAYYLDDSRGSIPTNIVLSAQPEAELIYKSGTKTVQYRRNKKAFLVLDGQHRLYGYGKTKKDHRVPVAIYENLSRQEEAALFIDINTTQRGVPASLLLDIKQVAQRESEMEVILRRFFDYLASEDDSPLNGLLSPARSVRGKISRVTFNRAITPVLRVHIMQHLPEDKQLILLKNYLKAAEESLRDKSLIRISAYFEAFAGVFEDVARLAYSKHANLKLDSLSKVLSPISNIALENVLPAGKTKITKAAIMEVLKQALSGQLEVSEDMV